MGFNSKWQLMKEIAAANNVSYNVYIYRIYNGQTPEEAASYQEPAPKKKRELPVPEVRKEFIHDKPAPKDRLEALQQIDDILRAECDPCGTRISMNHRNGSNSSRMEKICNTQCPVGKKIQELSEHLTVGPRKSAIEAWDK
ncbi:zinc-finger domain-containing protein [Bacillus altitudinis]|uniref:zinc-finger domain-containing protein n=1 Tax=Bacillus altitudinis TaxID=293387 RepID=UPI00366ABF6A